MKKINLSIVIAGKICSGKSTLANDLSKWLKMPKASFGSYLEHYSKSQGLPTDRKELQDLGERLIEEDHKGFLKNVIEYSTPKSSNLIFEGVRHKVILEEIKQKSEKTYSIFLDVKEEVRRERFINREKSMDASAMAKEDFDLRSKHNVERELDELKYQCNYIIISNDNYRDFLKALSIYI